MVARILGLDAVPKPADAADALALAICHAWRTGGVGGRRDSDAAAPAEASGLTPAQRAWIAAERSAAVSGAARRLKRVISSLRGRVLSAGGNSIVIEVGGVGFHVNTTPAHALASREGSEASVHTTLIVREDALTLFGFGTRDELDVFDLLIGVTGVGPKSALGVLSALSPEQVAEAVQRDDDAVFRKVSGIGPKTAKLITVSLAGKLVAPAATARPAAVVTRRRRRERARGAHRPRLVRARRRRGGRRDDGCGVRRRGGLGAGAAAPHAVATRARAAVGAAAMSTSDSEAGDLDLTDPVLASEAELAFEGALRPKSLAEFVGQTRCAGNCSCCSPRRCCSSARPTTSCSPARPGSARPRSR